jgi:hypothetical protein
VELVVAAGIAVVCGLVAGGAVRAMGESLEAACLAAAVTAVITGAVIVVSFFVMFGECLAENREPPRPLSYPWSPRREYCQEGTLESSLAFAIVLVPAIAMIAATFFRRRAVRPAAFAAYGLVALAPFVPSLYLEALPYYEIADTRVYFDPVLRPAKADLGPRVCMRHGIQFSDAPGESEDPYEERLCVDLEATVEARALTRGYDEGRTAYALDQLADDLTRNGAEEGGTDVDGLVVTDVNTLTLEDAGVRKIDANGLPVPWPSDLAKRQLRAARRAHRVAELMEACGHARRNYVGCDQRVQTRLILDACGYDSLRDTGCDVRRQARYTEISADISIDPRKPRSYYVSVTGGLEIIRGPGVPWDGPPLIRCWGTSCPTVERPSVPPA